MRGFLVENNQASNPVGRFYIVLYCFIFDRTLKAVLEDYIK